MEISEHLWKINENLWNTYENLWKICENLWKSVNIYGKSTKIYGRSTKIYGKSAYIYGRMPQVYHHFRASLKIDENMEIVRIRKSTKMARNIYEKGGLTPTEKRRGGKTHRSPNTPKPRGKGEKGEKGGEPPPKAAFQQPAVHAELWIPPA